MCSYVISYSRWELEADGNHLSISVAVYHLTLHHVLQCIYIHYLFIANFTLEWEISIWRPSRHHIKFSCVHGDKACAICYKRCHNGWMKLRLTTNSLMISLCLSHGIFQLSYCQLSYPQQQPPLFPLVLLRCSGLISNGKCWVSNLKHKNSDISAALILIGQNWIAYNC